MSRKFNANVIKLLKLYGFIIVFLILLIGLILVFKDLYLKLIQNNLALVSVFNISLVTILVLVNIAYSYFTLQIVDETKNDRKIAFIERQLVKFYYPSLNLLNSYIYIVSTNSVSELRIRNNIFYIENRNSNSDFKDIVRYEYLINNDQTKYLFEEFIENVLKRQRTQDAEIINLYEDFKTSIENDIKVLKEELMKLIY